MSEIATTPSGAQRVLVAPLGRDEGRMPTTPQHTDGSRSEPAVSVPRPHETMPAAMAAAVPDELAPALYSKLCGLSVRPCT